MTDAPALTITWSSSVGWRFSFFQAGAAERDALIDEHVVANLGGLADDDAHAVVDEQAPPDFCAGMNLDSGEQTRKLADHASEQLGVALPEPMRAAMEPDCVQTRVGEHDFERGARRGVAVKPAWMSSLNRSLRLIARTSRLRRWRVGQAFECTA